MTLRVTRDRKPAPNVSPPLQVYTISGPARTYRYEATSLRDALEQFEAETGIRLYPGPAAEGSDVR